MNETIILKRLDQYQCLKDFMGVGWFKKVINSSRPRKHPLFWLITRDIPYTTAILHNLTDNLKIALQVIEKGSKREEKEKRLCGKLKNTTEFYDALPEIEWAAHLINAGFPVSIEPTFPEEGPDLKVKIDGMNIYFEIKSPNRSEDKYYDEITDRIRKIRSRFHVSISLRDGFSDDDLFPVFLRRRFTLIYTNFLTLYLRSSAFICGSFFLSLYSSTITEYLNKLSNVLASRKTQIRLCSI